MRSGLDNLTVSAIFLLPQKMRRYRKNKKLLEEIRSDKDGEETTAGKIHKYKMRENAVDELGLRKAASIETA